MSLKDKYAIVGVGYTPQGRVPDRTALSFHVEACANAIKDAGLRREDIDGLIVYRHFRPAPQEYEVTPYLLAQHLGLSPKVLSQDANCSRSQLLDAMGRLEAGLCHYVVISYADNPVSGGLRFDDKRQTPCNDAVFGQFGATVNAAMAARRAMHTHHTGPETWREIAVGQRKWANLNPRAIMYSRAMTFEDYYNSRMVVEPLRLYDCSQPNDGGRAYVVTSVDRAKDLRHLPAVIMGIGQHNVSCHVQQLNLESPTGAKISGEIAFEMAGITLDDIDACEIYDAYTYVTEYNLQDYGFFKPGEGKDWFSHGTIAPGGRLPVNTSGGLLSEAYFMGLTPLTEGAMQIMGRCGERQLGPKTNTKEPEIILCCDNGGSGGIQTHSSTILRRL